jgi:hypothetical protein
LSGLGVNHTLNFANTDASMFTALRSDLIVKGDGSPSPDDMRQASASVKPHDISARNLALSVATPCEALGEGIDLIVMAPGKSQ